MLDSVFANDVAAAKADYIRKASPFWVGVVAQMLVGMILAGANPYGRTIVNWGVALLVWSVGVFWIAILARDWRKAKATWTVR